MFKRGIAIVLLFGVIFAVQLNGCSKKAEKTEAKAPQEAVQKASPQKTESQPAAKAPETKPEAKAPAAKKNETPSKETSSVDLKQYMAQLQIQAPVHTLMATDFTAKDLDGKEGKLSDYKGKVIFLNFWATWCPWCVKEMPSMQTLLNNLGKKYGKDFVILAVDAGETASQVRSWLKGKDLKFHFVLDQGNQINGMYGVRGLPSTYIVKKNFEILGRAVGARDWSTEASHKLFEALLKE